MKRPVNALVAGASIAAALAAGGGPLAQDTTPADSLAAQLRLQGYACDAPVTAQRDPQPSRPDEAVWTLKCANGSYRMRLDPDAAAKVEKLP